MVNIKDRILGHKNNKEEFLNFKFYSFDNYYADDTGSDNETPTEEGAETPTEEGAETPTKEGAETPTEEGAETGTSTFVSVNFYNNEIKYDSAKIETANKTLADINETFSEKLILPITQIQKQFELIEDPYTKAIKDFDDMAAFETTIKHNISEEFEHAQDKIKSVVEAIEDYANGSGDMSNEHSQTLWQYISFGQSSGGGDGGGGGGGGEDDFPGDDDLEKLDETPEESPEEDTSTTTPPVDNPTAPIFPEDNDDNINNNDSIILPNSPSINPDKKDEINDEEEKNSMGFVDNIDEILDTSNVSNSISRDNQITIPGKSYNGTSVNTVKGGLGVGAAIALAGSVAAIGGKLLFDKKGDKDDKFLIDGEEFDEDEIDDDDEYVNDEFDGEEFGDEEQQLSEVDNLDDSDSSSDDLDNFDDSDELNFDSDFVSFKNNLFNNEDGD